MSGQKKNYQNQYRTIIGKSPYVNTGKVTHYILSGGEDQLQESLRFAIIQHEIN